MYLLFVIDIVTSNIFDLPSALILASQPQCIKNIHGVNTAVKHYTCTAP